MRTAALCAGDQTVRFVFDLTRMKPEVDIL